MEQPITTERLDDAALDAALRELEGWERAGETITKRYRFKGFKAAIRFVGRVAEAVNRANHHPDIHIEHYQHVRIVLTTHQAKGVTPKDLDLARTFDGLESQP